MVTILEQWFAISQDDLDVACHCLTNFYPKKLAIACYHCQQSAEKALKAFLVYCGIEPPKTHDLKQLCEMSIEQDVSFNEIYEICSKLTPYGVATRYPQENVVDETIAKAAIDRAQKIHDFCLAKVPVVSNGGGCVDHELTRQAT